MLEGGGIMDGMRVMLPCMVLRKMSKQQRISNVYIFILTIAGKRLI